MNRKIILAALAVGALIAAGAAYGIVSHATATETITACVGPDGGMRLATATGACKKNENALTWNTVGPIGSTGPAGPAGPAGQNGQNGQDGRDAANPDAVAATLTVTSQRSGKIADAVEVSAVSHEIISPRDAASGLATGKRVHKPFVLTTQWGTSTPLLIAALVANENLTSVLVGLLRNGTQFATVKLTNANLSDYAQHGDTATFSFTYQKIEWTSAGGTSASDDLALTP
jgi:type VI secretion system secreted protein Hcp